MRIEYCNLQLYLREPAQSGVPSYGPLGTPPGSSAARSAKDPTKLAYHYPSSEMTQVINSYLPAGTFLAQEAPVRGSGS